MKRIAGHKLALVGLFFGLMFGLSVTIFKHWLSNEIADSIEDEIKAACKECSLSFDSFNLSFLTLSGNATNVRIVKDGDAKVSFAELRGEFSIHEILEKRVYLTSLTLIDGKADGVGPDSVLFKFVDQLTTPLPPELQRPNRWRVILDSLKIENAWFREPLGKDELVGTGLKLLVMRRGEAFEITPTVHNLEYRIYDRHTGKPSRALALGDLSADLVIDNGITSFSKIRVADSSSESVVRGQMDSHKGNECSGTGDISLQAHYIGLPSWFTGKVQGDTKIWGPIASPFLSGKFSGTADPLGVLFPHATPLIFPQSSGTYEIDMRHGSPLLTITEMSGYSETARMSLLGPLTFSSSGLHARLTGSASLVDYGPFTAKDVEAELTLNPVEDSTATHLEFSVSNLSSKGLWMGPSRVVLDVLNDVIHFDVKNIDSMQGVFHAAGKVLLPATGLARLDGTTITMEKFRYPRAIPLAADMLSPVALSGSFDLAGPIDLTQLTGGGSLTVSFPALKEEAPASGTASLRDGILAIDLPHTKYGGSGRMKLDIGRTFTGTMQAQLTQSSMSHFIDGAECSQFQGAMEYSFALAKPLEGSGSMTLDALTMGCAPYQLSIAGVRKMPISNGALQLDGLSVAGVNSSLRVRGSAGILPGYNATLQGDIFLSAFLPFLPGVDNLQGALSASLTARGPLSAPEVSGTLSLAHGEIGLVSPDITIREATGNFELGKSEIKVKNLKGLINDGELEVRGSLYPKSLSDSQLIAAFKDVTITPMADTTLTVAGELSVRKGESGNTLLAGDISIPAAEISRDIDPNKMLVQAVAGYFLSTPSISPQSRTAPSDIELDISLHAARNIFVLTPFLSAEFNAAARVRGTAAQPAIAGEMQVLSGWIGLKDNRFDITSGSLTFKPGALEPAIAVVGEGTLRSNTGENILVILEASGPVSSPRVTISSDQGLSNDELLVLLTASRSIVGRTMANTVGRQMGLEQRFLLAPDSFDSFGSFFRNLARIDSLSVEPIFNPFSGQTEPAVVGRKNLAERLTLAGQSTLGALQNARAGVVYNLTSNLNASSFIETVPSRQNTALRADLTYTVLSQQPEFLAIEVRGASLLDRDAILAKARIGPASRLKNSNAVLENIARDIGLYCLDQGLMDSTVDVRCLEGDEYCSHLEITINEGVQYTVSELLFTGDPLSTEIKNALSSINVVDRIPSDALLQEIASALTVAVRNEGFIAARIVTDRGRPSGRTTIPLMVKVDLRSPISFTFSGNQAFTAEEFLNSIELFSRKRPFGNNTIQLLIKNIERMYQDRGYLKSTVAYDTQKDTSGRVTYNIVVTEGSVYSVRNLSLSGNTSLSDDQLRTLMKEGGFAQQVAFLTPTYAVPDELDALRDTLIAVYQQEGFATVQVRYEVRDVPELQQVDINYSIEEGEGMRIGGLTTIGFPEELLPPSAPSTPVSIPRINRYITQLLDVLKDNGYLAPSISASPLDDDSIEIQVDAGMRTYISSILFDGLAKVRKSTVEGYSQLKEGAPFTSGVVNETKRRLLRSGLFSRVEIEPSDGKLNSDTEAITVRVVERPLRTLEVGGGANSEFGVHAFGEAIDKGIFADGQSLAVRLDSYFSKSNVGNSQTLGISQGFASVRYVNPSFLGSDFSFSEELRYQRQDITTFEFNQDRVSLSSYLYRSLASGVTLSAGHTVLIDDLSSVTPSAILSPLDDGTTRISFLSSVLALDQRDDPLLPHDGFTFTVEPKLAATALGSEADYASVISRASTILPLDSISPRFSLGLSGAAGGAFTFGDTQEVPITQRFYLGGRTTVRGFRENSLGPRAADGAVLGGDTLVMLKTQLQYLATTNISTHVFLDAGNVFLRERSFGLDDTRKSLGVGFRFLSPIGPLGIDVGHPLDERGGESSLRLHFSVGSSF